MQIYLVGGAVRDALLGLDVHEKDWVVVGGSVDEMLALGYKPVGKDFPVFLHPDTHEEYALARSERKTAPGYKGFVFHADPSVTLAEDLKRRDLTINAIAQDANGDLHDPFAGQQDLEHKILRHVSPAFSEDPVRLLRLARFASKLPDFTVCAQTFSLLQSMVHEGEVDALVPERVCKELTRTLAQKNPCAGMQIIYDCGAWPKLFPMLEGQFEAMQNNLSAILQHTTQPCMRFAAWCISLDLQLIKNLCAHLKVANDYCKLAITSSCLYASLKSCNLSSAETRLEIIEATDALRAPEKFNQALEIYASLQQKDYKKIFNDDLIAIKQIDMQQVTSDAQKNNLDIKAVVRQAKLAVLKDLHL
jgi:tRNA nucleotidyltransferase (CCA-adding enzyme)